MKDFVEYLKLPPTILTAIAMGTGLILLLPTKILRKLGLDNIPEQWKTVLGLFFIISSSLLVVYFVVRIVKSTISKYYWLRFKMGFPKVMMGLRTAEIAVVALLYSSPNYTSRLPYTDGVTVRLIDKKVIQLTSSNNLAYGNELLIPFTITPIAQDYIDKNPNLIENFNKSELERMYEIYNNLY